MNTKRPYTFFLVAICFVAASSCKTVKTVTMDKPKPIGTNRLIRFIDENAFDYQSFEIKRIACQVEQANERTSFRASLKSVKDEYILLSLNKLALPVARILLTPDSVKMVNHLEKTWIAQDYAYFKRLLRINVDFGMIQSILSNNSFSYRKEERDRDFKTYTAYADPGFYVLQSINERKLDKIERKEDKFERYLRRLDDEELIVQYLFVDPVNFKIRRVKLDDKLKDEYLTIDFDHFVPVGRQTYPEEIQIDFRKTNGFSRIRLKLGGFSTDPGSAPVFPIPEKYKRIEADSSLSIAP